MAWQVDYNHTGIHFSVRHMMISTVRGEFQKFAIDAELDDAEIGKIHETGVLTQDDVLNSHLSVQIDAASLNTRAADRDAHLRSPDFFNVAAYPYITFVATRGEKRDANHGRLFGDLTIRDITRPVALDVEFLGEAKSPWGTHSAGFSAQAKVNRKDWGLTWNVGLETGGWLVGDEIKIEIEIEFTRVPETVPAAPEPALVAA